MVYGAAVHHLYRAGIYTPHVLLNTRTHACKFVNTPHRGTLWVQCMQYLMQLQRIDNKNSLKKMASSSLISLNTPQNFMYNTLPYVVLYLYNKYFSDVYTAVDQQFFQTVSIPRLQVYPPVPQFSMSSSCQIQSSVFGRGDA